METDLASLSYVPVEPADIIDTQSWEGAEIIVAGIDRHPMAASKIIMPCQTHTSNVGVLTEPRLRLIKAAGGDTTNIFPATDALITSLPGEWIGIRTADCVPILLYAPGIRTVAAIHAGWKGTLYGIVAAATAHLTDAGADPTDIRAYIGPCICADCYEVSPELAASFTEAGFGDCIFTPTSTPEARPHIDLRLCNRKLLLREGLQPERITVSDLCTRHSISASRDYPLYSYRRNPGETGRNITAIRLVNR